jgi:hypothetical protein
MWTCSSFADYGGRAQFRACEGIRSLPSFSVMSVSSYLAKAPFTEKKINKNETDQFKGERK